MPGRASTTTWDELVVTLLGDVNDGSGIYANHAPAGAPPYTETGALLEGLSSTVETTPEYILVRLKSQRHGSSKVPLALEFGLGVQPHPYMGPAQERMATQEIPAILRARLGGA